MTNLKPFLSILIITVMLTGCASSGKKTSMTRSYFEYSRGKSFPTYSDVHMKYDNNDFTFHNLYLNDESFFPDNSIIPNAFIKFLLKLKLDEAQKAFTEPYYSYRLIQFLKRNPHIGFGIEFIHLKVFLIDKNQQVRMSGTYNGAPIHKMVTIGDYLDLFSVSHGVNHLGLHFTYRLMLLKTPKIKDGRLQPYANFSIGPAFPHLELNTKENGVPKKRAFSYQPGIRNWGLSAGLGARYKPWRHLGFYFEYKLSFSHLHGMHFDDMNDTNVSMKFLTHHLQWGISIMF